MALWSDDTDKSAFPGPIEGIPDIAVDNFTDRNKKAYFLSHFHADHTSGLFNNSKLEASVYVSKTTNDIIKNYCYSDFTYNSLSLEVLETGIIQKQFKNLGFYVTLVPVVHMPGAVMFLFESSDGKKILYTGDFVIEKEDLLNQFEVLHEEIKGKQTPMTFDLVYYDNTFENKTLPKRGECIEKAIAKTRDWLDHGDDRRVVFHTPYSYAFEDLFTGICGSLKTGIFLAEDPPYIYDQILDRKANVYTRRDECTKLRICRATEKHKDCFTKDEKTLHFKIYTWGWRHAEPIYQYSSNEYHLCFPTHCDKDQLNCFFQYFKAEKRIAVSEAIQNNLETPVKNPQMTDATVSTRPRKRSHNSDDESPGSHQRNDPSTAKRKLDLSPLQH